MGILQEFKEFAVKGNVIDMAVGVVIGTAFGKIVSSLVDDIVMPPIGYILKGVDFSGLVARLGTAEDGATIKYGMFIQNCLHFIIIAFVIFIVIKQINRLKRKEEDLPPTTKKCPLCTETISVEAKKCSHCTADLV